ncbi:hypothetical protein D0B54_08300 [Solimonas sp. K1W22B-7]|uniref:hypothetical protein n=1 Tax=Solimonas sp. K1W22B-7 TaxID=2303331 RepID=UPI000E333B93|nr:hypothetical protein [Solimonas sp. K1W22B-7]AXQ28679.1 hypothetical protein D0B54_08300 [Solimonas sp. K1W22B-7]
MASDWQAARHLRGQAQGHYESWFLRANHPQRAEAFWLRYTIFAPEARPEAAIGELWAVYFHREQGLLCAAKSELPLADCTFASQGLDVRIGGATLQPSRALGEARGPQHIGWDLSYQGGGAPLLFLPESLYEGGFPKAKAVTPRPLARFAGTLEVDGRRIAIDDWVGSENHNWGRRHTDRYAWSQVAGFDDAPEAFFEAISAQLKIGPLQTPRLTMLVLRLDSEEYRLNTPMQALRADCDWGFFDWRFDSRRRGLRIHGRVSAQRGDFVGLRYMNPPGGDHTCLNSKIAACELTLEVAGRAPRQLRTANRAAFEILTDETDHGISVVA